MTEDNILLTANEVAAYLGVHINTVWKYIKNGQLKAFKLGGNGKSNRRWRIYRDDLEAFIGGVGDGRRFSNNKNEADGDSPPPHYQKGEPR